MTAPARFLPISPGNSIPAGIGSQTSNGRVAGNAAGGIVFQPAEWLRLAVDPPPGQEPLAIATRAE